MIIPSLYAGFTGVAEVPRIDIVPTRSLQETKLIKQRASFRQIRF